MPNFEPKFAVKTLDQVSPGAMVIYDHAVAFAGINRSAPAPQQLVTLAVYDAANKKFSYRYFDSTQPTVLVPTGDSILRPKLDTFAVDVGIEPVSDQLFIAEETYIVVQLPLAANQYRLLSLNTGSLVTARFSQMNGFTSWEAGVMSLGAFVPLLKI
jgi:hypothetical protein